MKHLVILFSLLLAAGSICDLSAQEKPTDTLISINLNEMLLKDAIEAVAVIGDVDIEIQDDILPGNQRISVRVIDTPISEILTTILKGTGAEFGLDDETIVIFKQLDEDEKKQMVYGTGSLRGLVTDSTNGEAIPYANVFIEGTDIGTPTNTRGYYFIPAIPAGTYNVIYSFVGYTTKTIEVTITSDVILQENVALSPGLVELSETTVLGEKSARENDPDIGLQTITPREIQLQPRGLEADIFKVLQTAPGVSSTGDVSARYYVRGGSSDQNLVLLNGGTIYNPFHALGIFSVIDPEMISLLEFYKGGFNPEYGGRLSSILNIVTKDGNKNNYSATANFSLLSAKAAVEGPIPNGSFIATGRKSYYTDILGKFLNGNEAPFDFYDVSLKMNYMNPKLSENTRFVVHGFLSRDAVSNDDPLKEDFFVRNGIAGFNWNQIWGSPLYSNVSVNYSGFEAEVMPNLSDALPRKNTLHDITSDWHFNYIYESNDEMAFGVQHKFVSTNLTMRNLYGSTSVYDQTGYELSLFGNYKFFRFERVGLDIGMRSILIGMAKKQPFLLEPRVKITYSPNPTISFKASVGRYSQEMTTLSDENELVSIFSPWVIIPDYASASEATHYIIGMKTYLTDKFTIEIEAYYKDITDLLEVNREKFLDWQNDFITVDGESYGGEFLLQLQSSSLYFKASYALSYAYKINDGVKYHPRYDVRHSANVLLSYDLGSGWIANSTFSLSSGNPFTPIAGYYDRVDITSLDERYWNFLFNNFSPETIWGNLNDKRMPIYHRLDLSIAKSFKLSAADVTLSGSILNVYDQENIFYYDRKTGEQVNMLPFLPSISLEVKF